MRRKRIYVLVLSLSVLFASQSVFAEQPDQVVSDFMHHLIDKGRKSAEPFLFDKMIKIPEIKENTPIDKFVVLPTPQYSDTKVVVTFFKGEVGGELIAFIWELIVKDGKISRIKVIHDGTNPLMEEAKIVKEYEVENQKNVIVPTKFPFEITDFDGYYDKGFLTLNYRSEPINGSLKISITPVERKLEEYKAVHDEFYTLKDGTKVLYKRKSHIAHEIMFHKDGLQYYVGIGTKERLKKSFTSDDLIQIAESMK